MYLLIILFICIRICIYIFAFIFASTYIYIYVDMVLGLSTSNSLGCCGALVSGIRVEDDGACCRAHRVYQMGLASQLSLEGFQIRGPYKRTLVFSCPKAQHSPKTLHTMAFGPKTLKL